MNVVQLLSHGQLFVEDMASLSFTISQSLLKLISIVWVMPSNHLILCCLFSFPQSFPESRSFSNELALRIQWPKYWSFSLSPSNDYSRLISFRIANFSPDIRCGYADQPSLLDCRGQWGLLVATEAQTPSSSA